MKKSFRVATMFTGIAAASALTPAATAVAATLGTTDQVTPKITVEHCNSNTRPWVHLYYTAAENHGPACFGGNGTYNITSGTRFVDACTGNNYGYLRFSGGPAFHFGTGESISFNSLRVTTVHISGHTAQYSLVCS
jgi:hypothetical protein